MSTKRRTLGVHSQKRPLGPNGEKLCYNCLGPLPKGKPYNCSPKCSEEWAIRTSLSIMRHRLFQRDKGICANCGLDTVALKAEYQKLAKDSFYRAKDEETPRSRFLEEHGIPYGRITSDWWDADHITPVVEGGGECTLENYRTLCIPCHRNETKKLHGRLKKRRADARPLPLFDSANAGELYKVSQADK